MTDSPAPDHPVWRRPVIFDPAIGLRRLFWSELTHDQKFEELDYHAQACKRLRRELFKQRGFNHECD